MDSNRGPRIEVHPQGKKLATMIEQAQGANLATSEPTDTTQIEYILSDNTAPSSSRSIPSFTLFSVAGVHKLGAPNGYNFAPHPALDAEFYF